MRKRLVVAVTLACLVIGSFAAVASAEVITRAGASSINRPSEKPSRWVGPPIKIEDCSQDPFNNDEWEGVADLIAGQHYDVGEVRVEAYQPDPLLGPWYLKVIYKTTGDWYLTEYHVYVGQDPPKKSAPGQFPYKGEGLDTQEFVLDGIPYEPDDDGCVIVAAHAVVESRTTDGFDLDGFADSLPDCTYIMGDNPAADLMAYFDISVTDTNLFGDYYGWCVDTDTNIGKMFEYPAEVFSSYEALPEDLIEFDEYLGAVNWILNQQIVGMPSLSCNGDYTYGDVQRAIWGLVDDEQADGGLGDWDETGCRAEEIMKAAMDYADFVPDCGDLVGVILVPGDACGDRNYQFIIIPVPAECDVTYGEETAWAKAGEGFDCGWKTGWGSYMQFCYEPNSFPH